MPHRHPLKWLFCSTRVEAMDDEVAVVIPSRNRWLLLRTALASALAQTGVDVEVVVVDDGSVGPTPGELRAFDDKRVRVLRLERPAGVSAARNLGLVHVTAPWVAFLDDDDVWAPSHLSAMINAIRDSELDPERIGLAFSGHLDVDADRNLTGVSPAAPVESIHEGLKRMNLVGCPSRVVLRTAAVREVGGFDERLSIVADWDLWVRVLAEHEVVRCPELLVGYMSHPGNMHLDAERYLTDLALLRAKHRWSPGEHADAVFGDLLPSYIAASYRRSGRRFRAARWYTRSFRAGGSPRDLGRAIGVLLGERLIELGRLRRRTNVDRSLGEWLEPVRQAERATTTGVTLLPGVLRDSGAP
jgi:glycosyltransferase involved in cell wall biosynthesis